MSASLIAICPHCGYVNTEVTGLDGTDVPGPGDFSICIECFGVGIWTTLGGLRKPTDAEHVEIEAMPKIRAVRAWAASRNRGEA